MADSERRRRGVEMMKKVYAGDVVTPPAGVMAFSDLMLEQLFAEVWTREELPVRDRRLVLLGVIGALGEKDTFQIQVKAALKNGELTPAQVREVLITLASYAGYPRAAGLIGATEGTIEKLQVNVDFSKDPQLYEALDKMVSANDTDRSKFIRSLIRKEWSRFVRSQEMQKILEADLA